MENSTNLFSTFDFSQLQSPDFKEDAVREEIILPILKHLGYNGYQIVRSKNLQHPFLTTGSKKRPITLIPDYLLKVDDNYAWVLDAKSPNENIRFGDNIEQVYSYSIHPEIRTKYFALCNGRQFTAFRQDEQIPFIDLEIKELQNNWEKLVRFLSSDSFQTGKSIVYEPVAKAGINNAKFDYANCQLLNEIVVNKQSAKRHFGVHGYFTKQAWNVVQEYIKNFSQEGDLIFDPFGGSGVTAIEAMMTGRRAVHMDLNPMSVFMVESLVVPVNLNNLRDAYGRIISQFTQNIPETDEQIKLALQKYPYPQNINLPKGSDVNSIEDLFSNKQLAQLAYLKCLILKEKDISVKKTLLLMFSGLLTKVNLTYHTSTSRPAEGQGDSSIFRYYRYRIAPDPIDVNILKYFELRLSKIVNAKKEISSKINEQTIQNLQVKKGTAVKLDFLKNESVDYIYTDPPYGNKIPYLDLSTMWNGWLDLEVTKTDFEQEAIEGGELKKSKSEYNDLMAKSIEEMYRVLKYDRWMSFVFAHKDPEFWHLIIDTAEKAGFEYAGAVKQANGQTSFKKRQNPFTVLSGQLIINFKKVHRPRAILKANLGMNISEIIIQTIEGVIAKNTSLETNSKGATIEEINDELIIKGLEMGFLDLLKKEYSDLNPLLNELFDYSESTQRFMIRSNTKFRTHVDLNLRIRYYLISYLRRMELEKKSSTFDEIILHIIPLLKNGTTPEQQTVSNILESIGQRVGQSGWELKKDGQTSMFF
jgi:16S rRNA G966 N2-methylase RsmD